MRSSHEKGILRPPSLWYVTKFSTRSAASAMFPQMNIITHGKERTTHGHREEAGLLRANSVLKTSICDTATSLYLSNVTPCWLQISSWPPCGCSHIAPC